MQPDDTETRFDAAKGRVEAAIDTSIILIFRRMSASFHWDVPDYRVRALFKIPERDRFGNRLYYVPRMLEWQTIDGVASEPYPPEPQGPRRGY